MDFAKSAATELGNYLILLFLFIIFVFIISQLHRRPCGCLSTKLSMQNQRQCGRCSSCLGLGPGHRPQNATAPNRQASGEKNAVGFYTLCPCVYATSLREFASGGGLYDRGGGLMLFFGAFGCLWWVVLDGLHSETPCFRIMIRSWVTWMAP